MTEEKQIKKVPILANGQGLQLRTIEDMYRFGQAVVKSKLAPKSFTTAEQVLIAIQFGAELGMLPMQSLKSLCVINGQAHLYGDTPLALVKRSGNLEYIKEWIEGEGDEMVAHCVTKRKEEPEEIERVFSVADAIQAKLWSKPGPWQQYPKRMLQMRARSWNLRDTFPDCFSGATIAEEFMGIEPPEPSHEPTVPKRESRVVDSKEIDDNEILKDTLTKLYALYLKTGGVDDIGIFAEFVATECGGEKDNYLVFDEDMNSTLNVEAFTVYSISQIKEAIDNEQFGRTKNKAVRNEGEETDRSGQEQSAKGSQLPLPGVED